MSSRARCPGRVCLGGEDLDWMGGHSLQAAIGLEVRAIADCRRSNGKGLVVMRSDRPVSAARSVRSSDLGERAGGYLDFPQMALACLAERYGAFAGSLGLRSTLPIASGLASSAASIMAAIAAVASELQLDLSREQVCELAFATETRLKTGAGPMDFRACGYGGTRLARFEEEAELEVTEFPGFRAAVVIGDSGIEAKTSRSISAKRERFGRREGTILEYQKRTDALVVEMGRYLAVQEDLARLGACVSGCQEALASLMGSSTPAIDSMVAAALDAGSLGAKLSGGGGGGCMFALLDVDGSSRVADALRDIGMAAWETEVSSGGLVVEKVEETGESRVG